MLTAHNEIVNIQRGSVFKISEKRHMLMEITNNQVTSNLDTSLQREPTFKRWLLELRVRVWSTGGS